MSMLQVDHFELVEGMEPDTCVLPVDKYNSSLLLT